MPGRGKFNWLDPRSGYARRWQPSAPVLANQSPPPPSYQETVTLRGESNSFQATEWYDEGTASWQAFPAKAYYGNAGGYVGFDVRYLPRLDYPEYISGIMTVHGYHNPAGHHDFRNSIYCANSGVTIVEAAGFYQLTQEVDQNSLANMNLYYNSHAFEGCAVMPYYEVDGINDNSIYSINFTFYH